MVVEMTVIKLLMAVS